MRTKLKIKEWNVELGVDDDGHLTVILDHEDKSKVIALDADISLNDEEWTERFSTECIEAHHVIEQTEFRHMKDCSLGDNWKECPACIDGHNSTCAPKDTLEMPKEIWKCPRKYYEK
ncbi:MAG: hypothetical protein WC119_00670 [Synergistaceae bacterium]